jgi:hypothetical protein
MIIPTPGRVVWYRPAPGEKIIHHDHSAPLAALVAHVHNERCVNLAVINSNGIMDARQNVLLLQEGDHAPDIETAYCQWMPYQVGQAKRHEADGANKHHPDTGPSITPPPAPQS